MNDRQEKIIAAVRAYLHKDNRSPHVRRALNVIIKNDEQQKQGELWAGQVQPRKGATNGE